MASKSSDQTVSWRQHLDKYRASGLSRAAYCREHGLKVHQLAYHLYQRNKAGAAPEGEFAKIVVADSPPLSRHGCARLLIGGGIAVELDSGVDPTWVARLVAAIGGRP